MKKAFIIIGLILLIGVVYMAVRLASIVKDDTVYDVTPQDQSANGDSAQNSTQSSNSRVVQDNKVVTPSDDEIIAKIFPQDKFSKVAEDEYAPKADADAGTIGNTYIVSSVIRGDIDGDLYTDAFVITEITGAASVANTAFLVTRKGVVEGFEGSTIEGRILYNDGGFNSNRQLYVVYIQAVTGEKERVLYDYSVINGEIKLTKISSKVTPAQNPQG